MGKTRDALADYCMAAGVSSHHTYVRGSGEGLQSPDLALPTISASGWHTPRRRYAKAPVGDVLEPKWKATIRTCSAYFWVFDKGSDGRGREDRFRNAV